MSHNKTARGWPAEPINKHCAINNSDAMKDYNSQIFGSARELADLFHGARHARARMLERIRIVGSLILSVAMGQSLSVRAQTALTSMAVSPTIDAITDATGKILDAASPPSSLVFNPGWDLRCLANAAPLKAPSGQQLTWGDWRKVTGQAEAKCVEKKDAAGKAIRGTEIHAKLEGLIPQGVYTLWVVLFRDPGFEPNFMFQLGGGTLGSADGSENRFVASATGSLELTAFQAPGPLSQFGELSGCLAEEYEFHLWGAYHPDGKTYGGFPGPLILGPNGLEMEDSCIFATQFYFKFAHEGPPTLRIEQAVLLSWANLDAENGYTVESAAKVNGPWGPSTLPVTSDGIWLRVTAPTSDQAKYFRLAKKP